MRSKKQELIIEMETPENQNKDGKERTLFEIFDILYARKKYARRRRSKTT